MNRNNLILIGAIIVGLGIGTFIGLEQIKSAKTTIAEELNRQTEYNQTRTAEQREEVMGKIRAIFGDDLKLTLKETKTKYYSYGIADPAVITDFVQLKTIEVYEDNKGFTTEVDTANNEIINREKSCVEETQRITNDQAKEIAKSLLVKITDNSENYELAVENENPQIYDSIWRKWHEGESYSVIPSGKGQDLARMEERAIAICLRNGELMNYGYKPALTETELTEMAQKWEETQQKDIEALRRFLNSPDKQFTFVNYLSCSECGAGGMANSFRVYRDENGYCYDVDPHGNITPDTEVFNQCKTPRL